MADCAAAAVTDADLVMLCGPVGAMRTVGEAIAAELPAGAVVSDVGSVKGSVLDDLRAVLPKGIAIVPGHPVAGTEHSGPDEGFATLFHNLRCILTPDQVGDPLSVERVREFWTWVWAHAGTMGPQHPDLVLSCPTHFPTLKP